MLPSEAHKRKIVAKCTLSLCEAIQLAGGTLTQKMLTMSVQDFIVGIAAPNGITFSKDELSEYPMLTPEPPAPNRKEPVEIVGTTPLHTDF